MTGTTGWDRANVFIPSFSRAVQPTPGFRGRRRQLISRDERAFDRILQFAESALRAGESIEPRSLGARSLDIRIVEIETVACARPDRLLDRPALILQQLHTTFRFGQFLPRRGIARERASTSCDHLRLRFEEHGGGFLPVRLGLRNGSLVPIENRHRAVDKPTVKKLCFSSYVYPGPMLMSGRCLAISNCPGGFCRAVLRKSPSNVQAIQYGIPLDRLERKGVLGREAAPRLGRENRPSASAAWGILMAAARTPSLRQHLLEPALVVNRNPE